MSGSLRKIAQYVMVPVLLTSLSSHSFVQEPDKRVLNTIDRLIEEGYNPLPCTSPECATHLWKKTADGNYANVHQIDSTPYFAEVINQSNIAANKKSGGVAQMLSQFPETTLDEIDTNDDFKITNSEILAYRRKLIEEIENKKRKNL
ncbi:hypothetical protein JXA48_04610 [Candidatus Woesearchaeota archaeon]|nr:hypothetical protein [Candidatus Woesearchaeota archaeon]